MNINGKKRTPNNMSATTARDKFDAAVRVIRSLPKNGSFQPSNEMMLKFYAFYKQATEGECSAPKPNFWDVVKKAKWEAWNKLGGMSQEEAMCCYVDQLKTIVEAMPQTQLVAEFVEKLGSFYELVDDRTFSEKFNCYEVSCPNGDLPNGDVYEHHENEALNRKDYSAHPVNSPGSGDDSGDDSDVEEAGRRIGPERNPKVEDQVDLSPTKSEASAAFPLRASHVTSDTDSDVEYCDTLDDLHKAHANNEDTNSVTNGSDNDQVFSLSPIKQNLGSNNHMLTKLHKSADQALARIPMQPSVGQCEPVLVSSTHPFVYIPNRKSSTDSMHVNVPSRQSVSDVDHECAINGIPQDDPRSPGPLVVASDVMMDVPAHGGGEKEEKDSRKTPRRVSASGYGAMSRNLPRGQGEIGYYPREQCRSYQVSNNGGAERPGGQGPECSPPNITEQIAIALSRLQSDLDVVLQRLDTLEKNCPPPKVSYSWWPFPEVSMKTFLFFSLWPIFVHYVFHMATKRKNK